MKLGAQLFSLRDHLTTLEDIKTTFEKVKAMGYENVQFSGAPITDAERLRDICLETGTNIVCTHIAFDDIVNHTEEVIRKHKVINCPVIGLGSMPKEMRGSKEGLEAFLNVMEEPVKKIEAAGLRFSYHNHAFEFTTRFEDGQCTYDVMLENCSDWLFLLDTYWVTFGGCSPEDYMRKVGAHRLTNIHFKDMAKNEERSICACGDGILDFVKLTAVCKELGVENVLVEQDNARTFPDGDFSQMERSVRYLRPIVPKE